MEFWEERKGVLSRIVNFDQIMKMCRILNTEYIQFMKKYQIVLEFGPVYLNNLWQRTDLESRGYTRDDWSGVKSEIMPARDPL